MTRKAALIVGMLFLAHAAGAQFIQQGTKLVGTGAVGGYPTEQGVSVAISADSNSAIVGGSGDSSNAGAAWVYTRSGGAWTQQGSKLVGTGAVGAARQGNSVAISADGNTAIVGGPSDNSDAGAAWVYTRSAGVWTQQGSKLVGTGAVRDAWQGGSVAISADGNTAIIGGPYDNSYAGAAWVFTRGGGVWSQQGSKLVGTGAVREAWQGQSVAISADGNTAIIGGPYDNSYNGAAWVFTRSGGVWSQQGSKLVGTGAVGAANQGTSVAISADGNTAVVGGYWDNSGVGGAWVFTRIGGVWSQAGRKLSGTGAAGSPVLQGSSVAISADGNIALVGGYGDNSGVGGAWVFTRIGGVWPQQGSKLIGTGAVGAAGQGISVAISADGTTAIVGGWGDNSYTGAAWVFVASYMYAAWVPVASHNPGFNQSQWRSDLGLLNTGTVTANVLIEFFDSAGAVSNTTSVPAGTQSILTDVVGQLGVTGSGAIEVLSDRSLKVTARSYNQVSSDATCDPNGTQGQDYPAVVAGDGLGAGQSAYLAGLSENASYRCNIGLVNTGTESATVLVELYDGAGNKLTDYAVSLTAGQWAQETQPFKNRAGQTAMDRGYAKILVQSGSGVLGFASVIDNITNDPTTVAVRPAVAQFVQQGSKLVGAGAVGAANQGTSVAISADGNTAIVGGASDNSNIGAAWVYTRSGGVWTQQGSKLVGTGAVGTAQQGTSVAISADGNTAIIGGPYDNSNMGAAWVYTRSGGVWSQQGNKLVGSDVVGAAGQGISVAISGDGNTAIVGGYYDNSQVGAAWVYTRSGGVWAEQGSKLVGTGAVGNARQGISVAIAADGNTAIVGGSNDNHTDFSWGAGAAWVFTRSGGVWTQQGSKLVGTGAVGAASQGASVALSPDGNTAIVGGPNDDYAITPDYGISVGAAWAYTRSGGVWTQQGSKLVGTGASGGAGQGASVAISADGNIAIVGGPQDNGPYSSTGAAWVFTRSGGVWSQQGSKLVGTDAVGAAYQGYSVAISGDGTTAIVGGPQDNGPHSTTGAAWVFSTPTWTALWVPVASHNPGFNESQWRSDLGLLNTGTATANVQLSFYGSGGVVSNTTYVPPGVQSILTDVVGQLGASGSGAIEVLSDQPLKATARSYNRVASDAACDGNGTQGQDYPVLAPSDGLSAGQSAYLPGLSENASYRCNIGLVNTSTGSASVLVELFDGAGSKLTDYTVPLAVGWWQDTEPFLNRAGQTAMDRGYAKITVQSGAGVFAFASVIDNITNDPTTVTMQR